MIRKIIKKWFAPMVLEIIKDDHIKRKKSAKNFWELIEKSIKEDLKKT